MLAKDSGILWAIPFLFYIENIFGGPLGVVPAFSGRYLFFLAALLSLISLTIIKKSKVPIYTQVPLFTIFFFLAWNLIWATLVPAMNNTPFHHTWAEAKSLLGLLLVILFISAARSDLSYLQRLNRWIVLSAITLAWAQFILWGFGAIFPEYQVAVRTTLKQIYMGDSIVVGKMPDGFFRVFWISSMWLIPALFYFPIVIKNNFWRVFSFIGITGALMATYSRGIWIGIAIGMIFWMIPKLPSIPKLRLKIIHLVIVGPVLLLFFGCTIFWVAPTLIDRMSMLVSLIDGSANVRTLQSESLIAAWKERPLLGSGYGSSANMVRSLSAPYTYEMVPLSLLMKLGIIGCIGFFGFFIILVGSTIFVMRKHAEESSAFLGAVIAFLIAAMTNPLLFNFVGMSILSILLIHWAFIFRPNCEIGSSKK